MIGAFFYLTACSFRNRMRRRLRRLREPRYLIGLVVGALYFYFFLIRPRSAAMRAGRGMQGLMRLLAPLHVMGAAVLYVMAAFAWVFPGAGTPVTFSRSEVQFLFTAPVTRRQLLHFKLIRSQLGMLLSTALITLLVRPASLAAGWTLMAGLWLVFMAVRLHLMGVALSRSSLARHGRAAILRQLIPAAIVLGATGVLADALIGEWSALVTQPDASSLFARLEALSRTGAAGIVLWPFRALVDLPLSASPEAFWTALPPVLLLIAINYVWVLRSDAAFEEAAAEQAEKRARERGASRPTLKKATATPFQLQPQGPAETAILWKNLILIGRFLSVKVLLRLIPLVVLLAIAVRNGDRAGGVTAVLAAICIPMAAMFTLMGPQMMRNDLRQDLGNLALLKTWPVSGAAIVRGEVLAPTIVMSSIVGLLILTGTLLGTEVFDHIGESAASLAERLSYAAGAGILATAFILAQTVIVNGIAVLFPAWSAAGSSRSRGIDAMGQRLLMMAGILLTLVVALLPGAAVAAVLVFAVYWLTGTILVVLPALLVAGVVVVECWVATELAGRVLDRTDVTAIEASE